jgi:hypothetical protein
VWVLTDLGRDIAAQGEAAVHKAVAEAMREYNRQYNLKRKANAAIGKQAAGVASSGSDEIEVEVEEDQAERDWTKEI